MGGSGGGGHVGPIQDADRLRREVEEELQRQERQVEINQFLAEQLATFNDRDTELTRERLDSVQDALGDDAVDVDRLLFGGSVAKHTYVDGLSDVDALVVVNSPAARPDDLVSRLASALRRRLDQGGIEEIREGRLAVTIKYRDGSEVQILPAVERGGHTSIPANDGTTWRQIRPHKFAEKLTEVNQKNGHGVVPVIKLAKSLASALPKEEQLSGYHLEAIAVDAFRNYAGRRDRLSMLERLLGHAAKAVLQPTADITGQNLHIDDHLGARNSPARQAIASSLERLRARVEGSAGADDLRHLFGV